ncbi:hypothetical protein OEIGOIKO_07904 [Streptomyces chrestomyceticus JCM 4735]|uniref:Uncharacterized protein n=1 Tax=Streptomyces chrestomyceticus JCM 4735 TaxID=1306181 RepID=A0A7U9L2V6_9ACTN|nr:hypothetical protein OEIGOIKO_07904 [Streptomyces chrestomyceticus JCM 4735]
MVEVDGVGLAVRVVQGADGDRDQRLAQRVAFEGRPERYEGLRAPAAGVQGTGEVLQRGEPFLHQPVGRRGHQPRVTGSAEHPAPPQPESLPQQGGRLLAGGTGRGPAHQFTEAPHVHRLRRGLQRVAAAPGGDTGRGVRVQEPPQGRHMAVDDGPRVGRRAGVPQRLDDALGAHRRALGQHQQRQYGPALGRADRHRHVPREGRHRPEQPEVHQRLLPLAESLRRESYEVKESRAYQKGHRGRKWTMGCGGPGRRARTADLGRRSWIDGSAQTGPGVRPQRRHRGSTPPSRCARRSGRAVRGRCRARR